MRSRGAMCLTYSVNLILLTTSLSSFVHCSSAAGVRPYVDHPTCPRRHDLLSQTPTRTCWRKCLTDANCNGRPHRRCLCDGACGKSCVKWRAQCPPLADVENGSWQLMTSNRTFGAIVRYTCEAGFTLSGPAERVCRGDGEWSGSAPTCDTEGKCMEPPVVEHAVHDGNASQTMFALGTQLSYRCKTGFHVDGVFLAMCVGNGRWIGPRIKCSPRRCGHPGEIPNGFKNGSTFVYPNRVTYSCVEGYELIGRPYRVCQADGQWSGTLPECRAISCERLTAPLNGRMEGSGSVFGAVVRFRCDKDYRLIGSSQRHCLHNGTWNGSQPVCSGVECGKLEPFPNGYFSGSQHNTTVNTVIGFRCRNGKKFHGTSNRTVCMSNGSWSHPVPICWGNCVATLANGTILSSPVGVASASHHHRDGAKDHGMPYGYVQHDEPVNYTCDSGFKVGSHMPIVCYNGTWLTTPVCVPESCNSRPPDLKNGIIRIHMTRHGDSAQYQCDTGFNLTGDAFTVCQYGNWVTNETPECVNNYCNYPGDLLNGEIKLIGVTSKFVYRKYMRQVNHNERIEYLCDNKEYFRNGPAGATCIDGEWSPREMPTCEPRRHPHSYYSARGPRAIDASFMRIFERSVIAKNQVDVLP